MIRTDLLYYELLQAGLPVVGVSSDGRIDYSRQLTAQEITLADQVIAAHDPNGLFPWEQDEQNAVSGFAVLPDWLKTWIPDETAAYVHDNVLNGFDSAQVDAYVDGLPNTVAGMKTGLKQIGGALVSIRDILEIIAKLLMYIRDLIIKYK